MDYNKEEGDRAREAAMNKFRANDFAGARKYALKAQSLNPEMGGITQMVATFAMHLAAQHIINGEIDYYGVLGVKPEADEETVKKRYKKMAVMLHPDRNKSIGAEEAFKLVSQAWGVLSDKAKRAEYDLKRNFKASVNSTAKGKTSKRGVKRASDASASASSAADGAFWTVCSNCRTQYEYHRVYLNQNLLCPQCRKPFIAVETDPPQSGSIRKTFVEHQFDSILHLTDGRNQSRDNNGTKNDAHGPGNDDVSTKTAAMANAVAKEAMVKKPKPTIVTHLHELITIVPETEDLNMASAVEYTDKHLGDLTISVADCDFTKNRTEKCLSDNQIWASYDSLEGMPRVYFMIDKVLSPDPFKLRITHLTTSDTNTQLISSNSLASPIPRTCGGFRAADSQICKSPYIFSHKVEVIKGNHGEFLIYPRTGDVWALFKNFNYLHGDKPLEFEYDVVEVVQGYTEESGVTVVPLIKVAGFKSLFRHYLDPKEIRIFSKDDLSRFSHQIPSYLLTGRHAADELICCRQLDQAATPSQLLQVID